MAWERTWEIGVVGRGERSYGKVHSVLATGAYLTGEKYGAFDYSDKQSEVVFTEMFAPDNLPLWVYDWKTLFSEVEQAEKHTKAQFARSIYFTFHPDLSREHHIAMLKEYAQHFVEQQMIVLCALHDDGTGNPNAHFLMPTRLLLPDGTWAPKCHKVYVLDEHGEKIKLPSGEYKSYKARTTNWDEKGNVGTWLKLYEDGMNRQLERAGSTERVDTRSYEERGLDKIPKVRYSQTEYLLKQQGIGTECEAINQIIEVENQHRKAEAIRRAKIEHDIEQLKAKFAKKRKFRWKKKPSPQRKALQDFWSEVHEKESQITQALTHVWQFFKEEVRQILHDVSHPPHHERHVQEGRRPLSKET